MKLLMLRGQVPQDRNPKEIVFDNLKEVDDMWTQLFYNLLENNDVGELWYWHGNRKKKFANNFIERWVPSFETYKNNFRPDIIFARGAFKEYHKVFYRYPKAFKIRYGAGRRFIPQQGFYNYNIILQDSPEQVEICKKRFPKILTTLFIKPAADNIFYPIECEKEYDVCFPANGSQKFKGHAFIYKTVPSNLKLLNLGNNPHNYRHPENVMSYRVLRAEMPKHIAKCKVGIVAVESEIDSCPRIIPELLACGLPVVVLDSIRFWKEKYIISGVTGELANKNNFWEVVEHVLNNSKKYNPRKYYEENLSLSHAANFIKEKIKEII